MSMSNSVIKLAELNDTDTRCGPLARMKWELMGHQMTAIYAMDNLEMKREINVSGITHYGGEKSFKVGTDVGILADRVGSGKTLMVLGLICNRMRPKPISNLFITTKRLRVVETTAYPILDSNVILVPNKLVDQWIEHIIEATDLSYEAIRRKADINAFDLTKTKEITLISDSMWKSFLEKCGHTRFSRLFIDEADTIKYPNVELPPSGFLWLVTATPDNLRFINRYRKLGIFTNQLPWIQNVITIKSDLEWIEQSIKLPMPIRVLIRCLTPPELGIIKEFVPKSVVTMINAGNTDDAIKALNCNVASEDSLLKVVTNQIQIAIDDLEVDLKAKKKKKYRGKLKQKEHTKELKRLEGRIKGMTVRKETIIEKVNKMSDEICSLCFGEFDRPTLVKCCNNIFCFECLLSVTEQLKKCPTCQHSLYKDSMVLIDDNKKVIVDGDYERKAKVDVLLDLIKRKPDGKFLVFSHYDGTFKKVSDRLEAEEIPNKTLKGSSSDVLKTITKFKRGEIKVLMLNSQFFGAGMNLQMATDVVLFHRFDPSMEEQVIGRAQRYGRKGQLMVHYLMHDNEGELDASDKFDDKGYLDYLEWLEEDDDEVEVKLVYEDIDMEKEFLNLSLGS